MGILSLWIVAIITYGLWRFYKKYLESTNPEARRLIKSKNVDPETEMREKEQQSFGRSYERLKAEYV